VVTAALVVEKVAAEADLEVAVTVFHLNNYIVRIKKKTLADKQPGFFL
jgi:hypothetical protein